MHDVGNFIFIWLFIFSNEIIVTVLDPYFNVCLYSHEGLSIATVGVLNGLVPALQCIVSW